MITIIRIVCDYDLMLITKLSVQVGYSFNLLWANLQRFSFKKISPQRARMSEYLNSLTKEIKHSHNWL